MTGTRKVFVWRGDGEDEKRLIGIIADKAAADLFNVEGSLVLLAGGQFIGVTRSVMGDIVNQHVVSIRLTDREGVPERELRPFEFPLAGSKHDLNKGPTEKTLLNMIDALIPLVARAPVPPRAFQPGQLDLIKQRLRSGEPAVRVATDFHAEPEQIREIGRAAEIHVH
jgi:hypothetical protein